MTHYFSTGTRKWSIGTKRFLKKNLRLHNWTKKDRRGLLIFIGNLKISCLYSKSSWLVIETHVCRCISHWCGSNRMQRSETWVLFDAGHPDASQLNKPCQHPGGCAKPESLHDSRFIAPAYRAWVHHGYIYLCVL